MRPLSCVGSLTVAVSSSLTTGDSLTVIDSLSDVDPQAANSNANPIMKANIIDFFTVPFLYIMVSIFIGLILSDQAETFPKYYGYLS
jgi:hypothetical protein